MIEIAAFTVATIAGIWSIFAFRTGREVGYRKGHNTGHLKGIMEWEKRLNRSHEQFITLSELYDEMEARQDRLLTQMEEMQNYGVQDVIATIDKAVAILNEPCDDEEVEDGMSGLWD